MGPVIPAAFPMEVQTCPTRPIFGNHECWLLAFSGDCVEPSPVARALDTSVLPCRQTVIGSAFFEILEVDAKTRATTAAILIAWSVSVISPA